MGVAFFGYNFIFKLYLLLFLGIFRSLSSDLLMRNRFKSSVSFLFYLCLGAVWIISYRNLCSTKILQRTPAALPSTP